MIGFIKKDIAMIKSNFKLLGFLAIAYTFMGIFGMMDISAILPFMGVMIMISTFSYDTYNHWDAYSISLPNGRKNNVKAKYVATLIIVFLLSFFTFALSFIISYFNPTSVSLEQSLLSMLGALFSTLFVLSIMYPIIYKFGLEKARIGIFLAIFGIAFVVALISSYIDTSFLLTSLSFLNDYLGILLVVISILMVLASYKISEHIFRKKEF